MGQMWASTRQVTLKAAENLIKAENPLLRKIQWCSHIRAHMHFLRAFRHLGEMISKMLITRLGATLPGVMLLPSPVYQWVSLNYLNQLIGILVAPANTLLVPPNSSAQPPAEVLRWSLKMQDLTQPSPTLWKSASNAHLLVAAHLYLDGSTFFICFSPSHLFTVGELAGRVAMVIWLATV